MTIDDVPADETLTTPAGNEPAQGQFPHADIVRAWVSGETVSAFHVGMQLSAWKIPLGNEPSPEARLLTFHFQFKGTAFRALHDFECDTKSALQSAAAEDAPEPDWIYVGCIPNEIDDARASIDMLVNKTLLTDAVDASIREGDRLSNIFASVVDHSTFDIASSVTGVPTVVDRAPDAGYASEFTFRLGLAGSGVIELYSPDPIRVTNGEIGTFVYPVEARNHGDTPVVVVLQSSETPSGWTVRHVPSFEIPARSHVNLPVFLTVLGNHQHGTTATWTLTAVDSQGNSTARLDLGLAYPTIAQPSGHHPRMFLHSVPSSVLGSLAPWMNAVDEEDSPGTSDEPWHGRPGETEPTTGRTPVDWEFWQSPGLAVGLDFEQDSEALLHATLSTNGTVLDSSLEVALIYCPERTPDTGTCGSPQVLMQGVTTVGDFGPGSTTLDVPLLLTEGVDVIPYRRGANLFLHVQLEGILAPAPLTIALDIDSAQLRLPLRDYHDPVDAWFDQPGTLDLEPAGPTERAANPGDTIVFPFRIGNLGTNARTLSLDVESAFQDWAGWEDATGKWAADTTQEHRFIVRVPSDAVAGTVATFYLIIETTDPPVESLVARATVTVVDFDVEGDPEPVRESRKSPSMPLALLLLALAIAARRRPG